MKLKLPKWLKKILPKREFSGLELVTTPGFLGFLVGLITYAIVKDFWNSVTGFMVAFAVVSNILQSHNTEMAKGDMEIERCKVHKEYAEMYLKKVIDYCENKNENAIKYPIENLERSITKISKCCKNIETLREKFDDHSDGLISLCSILSGNKIDLETNIDYEDILSRAYKIKKDLKVL